VDNGYALGIDLGTTYTAAAVARDGRAEVVTLGSKSAAIPSVVFLKDDETMLVGEAAIRRAATDPGRVAREFKRRIGDPTPILLGRSPYAAEALMARLLRSTVDAVAEREGGPPSLVAVSHPANWGPYKLDLLMQAVRMADVRVDRYLTEPEAAAISWAAAERVPSGTIVAVYDLGGGTFDAAVLRKTDRDFEILGEPEGIERLGGVDFDQALLAFVASSLDGAIESLDQTDPGALAALARLRQEIVDAKEALSTDTDTAVPVLLPGLNTDVRVTRAEFESMIRPPLADTVAALRRALRSAGVAPEDVGAVVLVGGSSRIPLVAELVGEEIGRPVAVDAHPKHAVALGAALAASGGPMSARHADPPPAPVADATPPAPPETSPPPAPAAVPPPPRGAGGGRRRVLIGGGVASVALIAVVAAAIGAGGGGSPASPSTSLAAADETSTTTDAPTTTAVPVSTAAAVVGRSVRLDDVEIADGRYVVRYSPAGFEPHIDDDDASQFHVHFFWDVFTPEQAGTNAAAFGAEVGAWQLWDAEVFDGFAVADRPADATKICAVVGTHDHQVEDPSTFDCIELPD
jgi:actin-like ATPase involved in cell morphogenesis